MQASGTATRGRLTFAQTLVRSLATAGLFYGLVAAYFVPATLLSGDGRPDEIPPGHQSTQISRLAQQPTWRTEHRERFPGCVGVGAWTVDRVPTSVVVVRRSGAAQQMAFDEAFRRARTTSPADDVWTIGACR